MIDRTPLLLGVVAVLALSLAGCLGASKLHYSLQDHPLTPGECSEGPRTERLFGVALSGGGVRAAVFGAAGLEALREHDLLHEVTHVSSVSGGSFAATYFALHRQELLDEVPDETKEHLPSEFVSKMRFGYVRPISWRQFKKWRWGSATRRAISLQEVLDKELLHGKTFGELDGTNLSLLINSTRYDDARRFVLTSLCSSERPRGDAWHERSDACPRCGVLRGASFSDIESTSATPLDFPLSLAVVASASFPPFLGPISIEIRPGEYWHLGDGGVYDNQGVETLEELFLRELRSPGGAREALILVLDSGMAPEAKSESLFAERNLGLLRHTTRVPDILNWRADAYHDLTWESLTDELERTSDASARKMRMLYTDARLEECAEIPPSCRTDKKWERYTGTEQRIPEKMPIYVERIPTKLSIEDCAADLMERAAHKIVHDRMNLEPGTSSVAYRECPVLAGMQCREGPM